MTGKNHHYDAWPPPTRSWPRQRARERTPVQSLSADTFNVVPAAPSIPAVKEAELQFKEVDISSLQGSNAGSDTKVRRKSKLTTECHPDGVHAGGENIGSLFTYYKRA